MPLESDDEKPPLHFARLAHAARRAGSLGEARNILMRAEAIHPSDGRIQYDLACYETLLGNFEEAREHLKRALSSGDNRFQVFALTEPDLAPLWPAALMSEKLRDLGAID
jgi:tetratricopeptide (TPR) repeat protein